MNNIKAILEQINNIVLIVSPKGSVAYVSPSVKNILGFNPEDLLGENWWSKTTLPSEFETIKGKVLNHLDTSLHFGGIQSERIVLTSYGSEKWFLWNTSQTPDGNILSIGTDITDKKKTELAIEQKNLAIQEKNEELNDSLNYAKSLQDVILPMEEDYKNAFADAFVLYQPKDVVSGDFHWFYENEEVITVAAVDCTGHGVPGALMSVVGNSLLRNIVIREKIYSPEKVLQRLDEDLIMAMSKGGNIAARDGMDLSFVTIYKQKNEFQIAGAFRPVLIIKNGVLQEILGSRYPIGFYDDSRKHFELKVVPFNSGDRIYLFSDGYADQFGGPRNRKLQKSQLKEILIQSHEMSMSEQKDFLLYNFQNWRQNEPQTDDVLLMGLEM